MLGSIRRFDNLRRSCTKFRSLLPGDFIARGSRNDGLVTANAVDLVQEVALALVRSRLSLHQLSFKAIALWARAQVRSGIVLLELGKASGFGVGRAPGASRCVR
ncbi:hypothetical protein KL86PLE_90418 [uncultured Pleomorphomonas sp.]|uniref:Uncharacterized protein n=1 Tax=uncultured Pleomorphomonas sp. TaxID=442121 RepID=A0A212LPX4_9HYPH|nr:hypothetical protein KL86PLE_90418 [uncultured Pleomorphomonas sp.]